MTDADKELADRLALASLMEHGHWPAFEAIIRERRAQWQADIRDPRVYQSHAELVHVNARVAECDWLLELFESSRPGKSEDSP